MPSRAYMNPAPIAASAKAVVEVTIFSHCPPANIGRARMASAAKPRPATPDREICISVLRSK